MSATPPTVRLTATQHMFLHSYTVVCGDLKAQVTLQPSSLLASIK